MVNNYPAVGRQQKTPLQHMPVDKSLIKVNVQGPRGALDASGNASPLARVVKLNAAQGVPESQAAQAMRAKHPKGKDEKGKKYRSRTHQLLFKERDPRGGPKPHA